MRSRKSTVIPDTHKNPVSVTVSAVFPGGKLRENPVQATCHPFYAGFRLISRMQRLTGCCFLENIGCHNYQDVRAKRSSLYLLYPICIWIYVLTVAVVILVDSEQHKHGVRGADQLNKTIWLASIVALSMEAVLNNVVLFYRAPELVELLRTCGLIELYVNVPPYRQREAVRSAWVIIAFQVPKEMPNRPVTYLTQLADIALNMALDIYADFGTLVLVEKERTMAPFPMATLVSFGFLGIFFLAAHGLSARVLLTYFSRSIALYVDCIQTSLDRCLRSRGVPESSKVLQVDHARAQLSLVMKCADLASFILGPSLLYAYTYSVPLLCASAYYTIVAEFPFRVRLFFLFFFMLHYLSILVPPVEAHRMKNAVTKIQSIVQCLPMADCSHDLLTQLRMMLHVIKCNDLKYTACGFFSVDLPTFAALTGAVITYTVVLAQTSESYFAGTPTHPSNVPDM